MDIDSNKIIITIMLFIITGLIIYQTFYSDNGNMSPVYLCPIQQTPTTQTTQINEQSIPQIIPTLPLKENILHPL